MLVLTIILLLINVGDLLALMDGARVKTLKGKV